MRFKAILRRYAGTTPLGGTTVLKRWRWLNLALRVAVVGILLTSCATQKRCFEKYPPVAADTVITEKKVYRDTTFYVTTPADTVRDSIQIVIPCGEEQGNYASDTLRKGTKFMEAKAWIKGKKLFMQVEIKSQQLALFVDSIAVANTKTVTITKTVIQEKRVVPPFYKACLFVSIALLLLFALGIYLSSRR
jgi:UDP-N-acetylglucosamine enolpyruvyl transferase